MCCHRSTQAASKLQSSRQEQARSPSNSTPEQSKNILNATQASSTTSTTITRQTTGTKTSITPSTTDTTMTWIDQLFEFLRSPQRKLYINGRKFRSYYSVEHRDRSLDDEPIKHLKLDWEYDWDDDDFNYNIIWELQNIEILKLCYFPFESFTDMTATQEETETETETNHPSNNNNNINNINNNNENANSLTEATTTTPITIGHLSKTLKELSFYDCHHNHFHLPPDIGMLVNLTSLCLLDCSGLTCLPVEIGGLQSLQIFRLSILYDLQSIPSEIGNLSNLKELEISSCESLVRLPKEIGKLKSLQELKITNCDCLEHLPIELNHISDNLQKLEINRNKLLEQTGFSFQRALTRSLSLVGHTQELPLSMWPVVLEDVRKQIGWMQNSQSEQIMEASVIFSVLQKGPTLLDRTISAAAVINNSLDDTTNIATETEITTMPSEPIDDCKNKK